MSGQRDFYEAGQERLRKQIEAEVDAWFRQAEIADISLKDYKTCARNAVLAIIKTAEAPL